MSYRQNQLRQGPKREMPRGSSKKFTGDKPRESGSRGYYQSETRVGDKEDQTKSEAGNRKTAKKTDAFSGKVRTRHSRKSKGQEQLHHLENRNWKTLRDKKDWGENHLSNHHRRPRGNKESERTKGLKTDAQRCIY